ncbi:MAG: hypothetical protein ACPGUE_18900 [Marinomonas sp.]|jgi:hypothetical protein|uniref:hypothetical protein n=1 Tax=unclassified Marinomonas TaxID=196814 RepID=UPI0007AEF55A|nr:MULTISPECIES: hypothetical protein [unclassified Marinomonas]KZM45199.1 hypothetical protein OA92_04990 [Marinomonas sp. SBI22]KZM46897.1 hypothetical protein OA91_04045 [Marinomonas sp. SBI8L]
MNESYLEIVELENGEIVLRPASDEGVESEPLAVLKISDTTKAYLQDRYFELAKRMFHAGIDFVYSEDFPESEVHESHDENTASQAKVIH